MNVLATDESGLRAGGLRLLRELHLPAPRGVDGSTAAHVVSVNKDLCVRYDASTALWRTRGTMVHSFQTRPEFERYARDLAIFGTNQLEMVLVEAELSAPTPSQLAGVVNFSEVCTGAGMNVSLFAAAEAWTGNRTAMTNTLRSIPKLDSIFAPGGDGGQLVWPAVRNLTAALRQAHPGAGTWVSAQMLDR